MKISLLTLLASTALLVATPLFGQPCQTGTPAPQNAASASAGKLVPVTEKDAAWVAKERPNYPLDVCLISDDKLGSMGDSPSYRYQVEGKPDRLIVFCCDGCEEDFMADPAKHLARLDAAAKAKKAPAK